MKLVDKQLLKQLANELLFDMKEEEYDTLLKEFDTMLSQLKNINFVEFDNVEPMSFAYISDNSYLREDVPVISLTKEEVLSNAPSVQAGQIKIPKVVE